MQIKAYISTVFVTLVSLLILAAVFYGGYLLRHGNEMSMPSLFRPPSGARMLMSMDDFTFAQSENGKVSWRMKAGNADLYENKEVQLKDLVIDFKSPDAKREATLIGASGTMDTASGNASVSRGAREVKIVTSDGYLLTTNTLHWKAHERLVWTPDPFTLLGSEIYLEGIGMSANVDLHTFVVKNNVKAVLQE